MNRAELKSMVCKAIDGHASEIIQIGDTIWRSPEAGFREVKTARYVADKLRDLGLKPEEGIGITGILAKIRGKTDRPNVAVMGELASSYPSIPRQTAQPAPSTAADTTPR